MPAPEETKPLEQPRRPRKKSSDEHRLRKLSGGTPLLPPKPGGVTGPSISVGSTISNSSEGRLQSSSLGSSGRRRMRSQSSLSHSSDQVLFYFLVLQRNIQLSFLILMLYQHDPPSHVFQVTLKISFTNVLVAVIF